MSEMGMTVEQFMQHVIAVAADCGYGWVKEGRHHPEDLAVNLAPVMQAFAAGYAVGYRRGVGK